MLQLFRIAIKNINNIIKTGSVSLDLKIVAPMKLRRTYREFTFISAVLIETFNCSI